MDKTGTIHMPRESVKTIDCNENNSKMNGNKRLKTPNSTNEYISKPSYNETPKENLLSYDNKECSDDEEKLVIDENNNYLSNIDNQYSSEHEFKEILDDIMKKSVKKNAPDQTNEKVKNQKNADILLKAEFICNFSQSLAEGMAKKFLDGYIDYYRKKSIHLPFNPFLSSKK
jgi:hypothetical protein